MYTCRSGRLGAVGYHVDDGKEIGCCLAGAGLSHRYEVAPRENLRNRLLLDGSTLVKPHGIQCVKDVVAEVGFFKSHI